MWFDPTQRPSYSGRLERWISLPSGEVARDLMREGISDGTTVIADASAEITAGERVLIQDESGTGKSTQFRAIGGLWPWGAGEITISPRETMMFMPQRPYLPLGTLADVLCYPKTATEFPRKAQEAALMRVGLERLPEQPAVTERWDRVLSLGEHACRDPLVALVREQATERIELRRDRAQVEPDAIDGDAQR